MTAIRIICGSRVLADREDAAKWAYDAIAKLAALKAGEALRPWIVTGEARGPDAWAIEAADPWRWTRWAKDGAIYTGMTMPHVEARWTDDPLPRSKDEWRKRLLARDRAMVEHYRNAADVELHAFIAPWATTHGSIYTAKHAASVGIRAIVHPFGGESYELLWQAEDW